MTNPTSKTVSHDWLKRLYIELVNLATAPNGTTFPSWILNGKEFGELRRISQESPDETKARMTDAECNDVIEELNWREWRGLTRDDVRMFDELIAKARKGAQETNAPLPPEVLVDALQDVVHTDPGPVRAGRSVKAGACNCNDGSAGECPVHP